MNNQQKVNRNPTDASTTLREGDNSVLVSTVTMEESLADFDGQFEILEEVGRGGMGIVYKVRDKRLNKFFALKIINPGLISDQSAMKRFEQEAESALELAHANLVSIYCHRITSSGSPYILMELVDGTSLSEAIKREGRLDLMASLSIAMEICDALTHAHSKNIIHRDLKPSNVLLSNTCGRECVKIVDFGIAKVLNDVSRETQGLTATGLCFGSPLYMSPEQCKGEKLDGRSDVYSLGCMLYEMLTGTTPYQGDNALQTMVKHISGELPTFSSKLKLSDDVKSVILHCLEKDPDQRYQSMEQLRRDLENLSKGKKVLLPKRILRRVSNKQVIAATTVVSLVMLVVFLFVLFAPEKQRLFYVKPFSPELSMTSPEAVPYVAWELPPADPNNIDSIIRRVYEADQRSSTKLIGLNIDYNDIQRRRWAAEQERDTAGNLILKHGKAAVPKMLVYLSDHSSLVRRLALNELTKLAPSNMNTCVDYLINHGVLSLDAEEFVDNLGTEGIVATLPYLSKTSEQQRMAADLLMRMFMKPMNSQALSSENIPQILQALKTSKDGHVRAMCAYLLTPYTMRERMVQIALLEALKDKDSNVRIAALSALGTLAYRQDGDESRDTSNAISVLLEDQDSQVRFAAISNLAALGPSKTEDLRSTIEKASKDKSPDVALAASLLMAETAHPDALLPRERKSFIPRDYQVDYDKQVISHMTTVSASSSLQEILSYANKIYDFYHTQASNTMRAREGLFVPMFMRQNAKGIGFGTMWVFGDAARPAVSWMLLGLEEYQYPRYTTYAAFKTIFNQDNPNKRFL